MNYEDRMDLLPPEQVVAAGVLERLRSSLDQVHLSRAALDPASAVVEAEVLAVMRARVQQDVDDGCPPEAAALELDAMQCGYRLVRLALGGPVTQPESLLERVEALDLHALPPVPWDLDALMARNVAEPTGAEEESLVWALAFGVGAGLLGVG